MTLFSAAPQTLGYLHQVRYALVLLLDHEDYELRLEQLDDIDLSGPGSPLELLQLKHRKPGTGLTDGSEDLWKTLRVWSDQIRNPALALGNTMFSLLTTGKAPEGSAAAYLRPGAGRDVVKAENLLTQFAKQSRNKKLKSAFDTFQNLDGDLRVHLLSSAYVFDDSPNISSTREMLESKLSVAVQRQYRSALADRVEGWWFERCIQHLRGTSTSLSGYELFDKVVELVQQFQRDALPIDFLNIKPDKKESQSLEKRMFVGQLQCVDVSAGRIQNAIVDYYRAYAQRSQWARDELLIGNEIETYEERLRDEWDRMRLIFQDEAGAPEAEDALKRFGRDLLAWMETSANVKIRENVTEPYVMRGSYHMLADEDPPRVWWHPKFVERIAEIVGEKSA